MPRNEGFLDPGTGQLASFAWDLRMLRETAGKVPYRVLAKRAGFCASTLSVAVPVNGGFEVHLCPAKAGATSCS